MVPVTHLSACEDMACQLYLGKVALADSLEQPVVTNVGLLVGARCDGVPAAGARTAWPCADLITAIGVRGVLWRNNSVSGDVRFRNLLCFCKILQRTGLRVSTTREWVRLVQVQNERQTTSVPQCN